mgnify:CR=1 FL=1
MNPAKIMVIKERLLAHKLGNKLLITTGAHHRYKKGKLSLEEFSERIDAAKFLFVDFLESIVAGKYHFNLPESFSLEKLKEVYEKSDFDWKDPEKYSKFRQWYISSFH